jgi:hypothetical protein
MKRALLLLVFILLSSAAASAQSTFYFPQIADGADGGGFWKTTIYLTNAAAPGASLATGTVTFLRTAGGVSAPLNVAFVDGNGVPAGSGNTLSFQIAGGQIRKFVSTAAAPLLTGFATVSSDVPVTGTAIFSRFAANGSLVSEAGVPAATASARQAILVDTLGGFNTGVAYANPSSSPATISLQLLNLEGVAVGGAIAPQTLPANGHNAVFVNQFFSGGSAPAFAGTMQITSDTPLAAVALRFDPTFSFFTTLPPVSLASLFPTVAEWIGQLIANLGFGARLV